MFKKLQNLLFEDEDDDIVNEEGQGTAVPQQQPVQAQPAAVKPAAPVQPEARPAAPAPVQPIVQPAAKPEPITLINEEKSEEVKKPTLGITVDDVPAEKKKPTKANPIKPTEPAKKEKKDDALSYQFRPVISPIFGVDEKDVNSLKNTTNKIKNAQKPKKEPNVTPVLSPMYGVASEDTEEDKEEAASSDLLSQINATNKESKEDDIPEFSLDDILKVRDQEFADEDRAVKDEEAPIFPDLTFDDDDAPEAEEVNEDLPADLPVDLPKEKPEDNSSIDNTVIIKQQLFDDDEN